MECCEIDELCFDYVEGRLLDAVRDQVAAHLEACGSCKQEIELYRRTAEVIDHVHQPDMPECFWQAQARRILAAVKPAVVWEAPPMTLVALLLLPSVYLMIGLEGLGMTSSGFLRSTVEAFTAGEALTLIPLYGSLIALAFFTFSEPDKGRVPD